MASTGKGKQMASRSEEEECPRKRWAMYDHSSSSDDFSSNEKDDDDLGEQLESVCQLERSERDERVAHPQTSGQPTATSSVAMSLNAPPAVEHSTTSSAGPYSWSNALINQIRTGVRPTPQNQLPPVSPSKHIRGPANFGLQAWKHTKLHTNRHVPIQDTTYWSGDVSKLWKPTQRYWHTGKLFQLVHEASRIPYD